MSIEEKEYRDSIWVMFNQTRGSLDDLRIRLDDLTVRFNALIESFVTDGEEQFHRRKDLWERLRKSVDENRRTD